MKLFVSANSLIIAVLTTVPQISQATPLPMESGQTASTPDSANSKIAAKAKEWFQRFKSGDIDRTQLNPQVNSQLTDTMIRQEGAKLSRLGNPTAITFLRTYSISGATGYDFLLQFKAARVVEMIAFDTHGKIAGIDFQILVRNQSDSNSSHR
jgi:hypothetical protein